MRWLADAALEKWLIPFGTQISECPCKRNIKWTLQQWRDDIENRFNLLEPARERPLTPMNLFDRDIESAAAYLEDFQAQCGKGVDVQPTLDGIAALGGAASSILRSRSRWDDLEGWIGGQ